MLVGALTASATNVPIGVPVKLTATANRSLTWGMDFDIQIWDPNSNKNSPLTMCHWYSTCSITVNSSSATSVAYHAAIYSEDGAAVYVTSSTKTVHWTNTWSVGLTASLADGTDLGGLSVTAGTAVTLTATSNYSLIGTGYYLWIQDLTGTIVNGTVCGGTKCVTTISSSTAGSMTYRAYVGTVSTGLVGSAIAYSGNLVVTWTAPWTVSLKASASKATAGTTITLTATANQDVDPTVYEIEILNSSGSILAHCESGTTCTAFAGLNGVAGTYRYMAEVVTSIGSVASMQAASVSVTVTISPGAATHFKVAVGMNPWPAGSTHSVTVTALDAYGNVATGYTGTIHFTTTDAAASVPADYKFTAADKGVHTFANTLVPDLTLKTVGSRKVTATDVSKASITGSQTVTVQ